jgi:phosphoserine phosphatase
MKVFDFDNTIYDGETMVDFFYFIIEKKEELKKYKGIVDKLLKLYEHNMLPISLIKRVINKHRNEFGFSTKNIDKYIEEFWKLHEHKIRKDMLSKISKDDVIMTASLNVLIDPIKKKLKTKNVYTSIVNIETKEVEFMCYKENKVTKFREIYKDEMIDELYTDSYADKPLMNISKKVFLINKHTKEIKQIK